MRSARGRDREVGVMEAREAAGRGRADGLPITVSQLNRTVAGLLERSLPLVWVRGEVSNFVRAGSGHCYFTLKDEAAQVRAVMFRSRANALAFKPRDGDRIDAYAQVSMYEARGDVQLVVETARQVGGGELYREFLRLKEKLQGEGLFDAARKRAIPTLPRVVGVISSLNAAALRDVLTTLAGRAPHVRVIVYPCQVQGREAPASIVAALARANARRECDLLLLVRGGGAIEDLWAFNDEAVARAVAQSAIPLISGVGHETDVTICDFAADRRAPTPTGAAMLAASDRAELRATAEAVRSALARAFRRVWREAEQRLDAAARRLRPPSYEWARRAAALDAVSTALMAAASASVGARQARLATLSVRIRAPSIESRALRLEALARRLRVGAERVVEERGARLRSSAAALDLVSPLAVLARGYAIVRDSHARVVAAADSVEVGEQVELVLARGTLAAEIVGRDPKPAQRPAGGAAPRARTGPSDAGGQ